MRKSKRITPAKTARGTAISQRKSSKPEPYELTEKERALADTFLERFAEASPEVWFKVKYKDGGMEVSQDHPEKAVGDMLFKHAVGTTNTHVANGLMNQIANAVRKGKELTAAELNRGVAMVQGIAPRDETEAMLATQMVAIHNATMKAALQLNHIETLPQQDSASNMLYKLARTFTSQVEALKKYRSTGEQNIRVQHVNVSDGGQAIVGNVQTGGGGKLENGEQSHEPGHALAQRSTLPSDLQEDETPMPSASRTGKERVPISRCARRSAKRPG